MKIRNKDLILYVLKQSVPFSYQEFEVDIRNAINSSIHKSLSISETNIKVDRGSANKPEIEIQCQNLSDEQVEQIRALFSLGPMPVTSSTMDPNLIVMNAKQTESNVCIEDSFNNEFPVNFSNPPEIKHTTGEEEGTFRIWFKIEDNEDKEQFDEYLSQNTNVVGGGFEYCRKPMNDQYLPIENQVLFKKYDLLSFLPSKLNILIVPIACSQLYNEYNESVMKLVKSLKDSAIGFQEVVKKIWKEKRNTISVTSVAAISTRIMNETLDTSTAILSKAQDIKKIVHNQRSIFLRKLGSISYAKVSAPVTRNIAMIPSNMQVHARSLSLYFLKINSQIKEMREREKLFKQLETIISDVKQSDIDVKKTRSDIAEAEKRQKESEEQLKIKEKELEEKLRATEQYWKEEGRKRADILNDKQQELKMLREKKKERRAMRKQIIEERLEEIEDELKKLRKKEKDKKA